MLASHYYMDGHGVIRALPKNIKDNISKYTMVYKRKDD